MANAKKAEAVPQISLKIGFITYTIEFLGTWEMIHNLHFKVVEFDHFRMQAEFFVMSVSDLIEKTNAIGLIVKKGRYAYP